jgi:hypothetical protein
MARYIDADVLEQDLRSQYKAIFDKITKDVKPEDSFVKRNQAYYARLVEAELNTLFDYLKDAPTADVVEVKHGEWIDNGIQDSMLSKCSVCGILYGACTFKCCPECGAKMDGNNLSTIPTGSEGRADNEQSI